MCLTTYHSAGAFVRANLAYLERQEVVNGLMIGLALVLKDEPLRWGSPPYLAGVSDESGPCLCALMTPPHNLTLYSDRTRYTEALGLVADDLLEHGWPVSGVNGPNPLSDAFAALWAERAGVRARPHHEMRVYELRQVVHPTYPSGRVRPARADEADLVVYWSLAFQLDALAELGDRERMREQVPGLLAGGEIYLWDDGGPASMAARARPNTHGITVNRVYTPPALRRRGYASACVAALSQRLLEEGFQFCTLFTNLANPTSNDIYQKIGYRPVCDFREIKFERA
jgi:predicted GNAT family acetyltransferase